MFYKATPRFDKKATMGKVEIFFTGINTDNVTRLFDPNGTYHDAYGTTKLSSCSYLCLQTKKNTHEPTEYHAMDIRPLMCR